MEKVNNVRAILWLMKSFIDFFPSGGQILVQRISGCASVLDHSTICGDLL
jgi:hypothetical protein